MLKNPLKNPRDRCLPKVDDIRHYCCRLLLRHFVAQQKSAPATTPHVAATQRATNMLSSDADDDVIITGIPLAAHLKRQIRKKEKLIKEVSGYIEHAVQCIQPSSQTPRNWPSILSERSAYR